MILQIFKCWRGRVGTLGYIWKVSKKSPTCTQVQTKRAWLRFRDLFRENVISSHDHVTWNRQKGSTFRPLVHTYKQRPLLLTYSINANRICKLSHGHVFRITCIYTCTNKACSCLHIHFFRYRNNFPQSSASPFVDVNRYK